MENKNLITPINENINEDKNEWIFCGPDDVCDDCRGICDPSFQ